MLTDLIKVEDLDTAPVEQKVSHFLTEAKALLVEDEDDYQYAAELLRQEKAVHRFVEDFYKPTKDALNTAKAELMKNIKAHTGPLSEAEGIIKKKMGVWHEKQEKIRREERKKIEAELRKQEEERRLNEAIETGDDSILEEPVIVPVPKFEDTAKAEGISYRDLWHGEVVNPALVPREYLMPDEKKIDRMAKATEGKVAIPGVKIWKEQIIAARRA